MASRFRDKLKTWGITKPIKLTTTKVDDELIEGFNIESKERDKTLLFLARIEQEKGIFITLQTFKRIKQMYSDATLLIAGDGSALTGAKEFVEEKDILDVKFKGYIRGDELKNVFKRSDIYILPTYGEGMPTSVLEAMAFGLAVVTRPVGGMVDFFENGKMGYVVDSMMPSDFTEKVIEILNDKEKIKEISRYNHQFAMEHFLASKVAVRLEESFMR